MKLIKIFLTLCISAAAFIIAAADDHAQIFDRAAKYLDKGGTFFFYKNTENLDRHILGLIEKKCGDNQDDPLMQMLFKTSVSLVKDLNISDLQAIGASGKKMSDKLYLNKLVLVVKKDSNGPLFAGMRRSFAFAGAANLPDNVIYAFGGAFNGSDFFNAMRRSVKPEKLLRADMLLMQFTQVPLAETFAGMNGEFFNAVYYSGTPGRYHRLTILPDSRGIFKKAVKAHIDADMTEFPDGSLSFSVPLDDKRFGEELKVLFAGGKIYIYSSDADLKKLLNADRSQRLLSSRNAKVFGFLNDAKGAAYCVLNLNTRMILPEAKRRVYRAGMVTTAMSDGYLSTGKSNFDISDISDVLFFIEALEPKQSPNKTEEQPQYYPPM